MGTVEVPITLRDRSIEPFDHLTASAQASMMLVLLKLGTRYHMGADTETALYGRFSAGKGRETEAGNFFGDREGKGQHARFRDRIVGRSGGRVLGADRRDIDDVAGVRCDLITREAARVVQKTLEVNRLIPIEGVGAKGIRWPPAAIVRRSW